MPGRRRRRGCGRTAGGSSCRRAASPGRRRAARARLPDSQGRRRRRPAAGTRERRSSEPGGPPRRALRRRRTSGRVAPGSWGSQAYPSGSSLLRIALGSAHGSAREPVAAPCGPAREPADGVRSCGRRARAKPLGTRSIIRGRSPSPALARRLQRASRVALYGSMVLVMAAGYGMVATLDRPAVFSGTEWIEYDSLHDPTVRLLQRYVQIDTSEATGNEEAGDRFLAAQLAAAGIRSEIEVLDGRHANLFARLEGRDPHPLVLHNHIDVSNVDPSEWIHPPFAADIELPWIWGRGVFDMKSIAIAQLLAMIDLAKSGRPLRRSVQFLATGDEEAGDSRLGVQWVIRHRPEMVHDFWAVLTEGGTVEARSRSDIKYWGIEIGQKHFARLTVCSDSRERLEDLRRFLLGRRYTATDLHLLPEIAAVLEGYAPSRDSSLIRGPLTHPRDLLSDIGAFRAMPAFVRSMLRNEAVPFHVKPAPGGGYELLIKIGRA